MSYCHMERVISQKYISLKIINATLFWFIIIAFFFFLSSLFFFYSNSDLFVDVIR